MIFACLGLFEQARMKRTIIKIDEELCNGCGFCVTGCYEGALQLIGGKAVLVSDRYCDGLGACMGECPVGAIFLEEREAEPYLEESVLDRLIPKGDEALKAHFDQLLEAEDEKSIEEGLLYLNQKGLNFTWGRPDSGKIWACPGNRMKEWERPKVETGRKKATRAVSELRQFPIQLQLLNTDAVFLKGSDFLLAADCTAYASAEFHSRYLKGKNLAIACPKLDPSPEAYVAKLAEVINRAELRSFTVLVMDLPCCERLVQIVEAARRKAKIHIPVRVITLSLQGEMKNDRII